MIYFSRKAIENKCYPNSTQDVILVTIQNVYCHQGDQMIRKKSPNFFEK